MGDSPPTKAGVIPGDNGILERHAGGHDTGWRGELRNHCATKWGVPCDTGIFERHAGGDDLGHNTASRPGPWASARFHHSFALPGRYKVWVQTERDYAILTAPTEVEVPQP